MAATKALKSRTVPGASTLQVMQVTGDAAYVQGGYSFLPADFNLLRIRRIISAYFTTIAGAAYELAVIPTYTADGVTIASFNVALVVGTSGAEAAAGANLAAVGFMLVVEGN